MEDLELFFMKLQRQKGLPRKIGREQVKEASLQVKASFKYNFKSLKADPFFSQMKPKTRQKLVLSLFGQYTKLFSYFFCDIDHKYSASDSFISGIL